MCDNILRNDFLVLILGLFIGLLGITEGNQPSLFAKLLLLAYV